LSADCCLGAIAITPEYRDRNKQRLDQICTHCRKSYYLVITMC
jgi:hypothetical protein